MFQNEQSKKEREIISNATTVGKFSIKREHKLSNCVLEMI